MKALFVTGTLTHGGAQRVIAVVASQMASFGHDVSLVVFKRFPNEYPVSPSVKIFSLAESEEEYDMIPGWKRVFMLRKIIKEIRPEVAVGFLEGGYGMYLSSFGMGIKRIASARVNPKFILEETGLRALVNRIWFRRSDLVVLQTKGQEDLLGGLCRKEKCTVIANPIADTYIQCPPHDYSRRVERIIMVGRLNEQKDYPTAIEAMALVKKHNPDIRLDIIGEGDEREKLEALIKEKGLEDTVRLMGWSDSVGKEEEESDLYLMTSLYEGMPNALMEAMASGLVVVSTDCETGPSDLIEDGKNGFLVPVGDVKALSERIISISEMTPSERERIGSAAKTHIRNYYSSETIGRCWEKAMVGLLKKGKGR